jgi:hypothetical protein
MITLHSPPGMSKKAEGEVGMVANPREAAAQRPPQRQDLGWTQVGEIAPFDVAPELLDRVEVRGIGRQALDLEPRAFPGQVGPHPPALVGGQSIPEEDDGAPAEVALERAQERNQAAIGVGTRTGLKVDPTAPAIPAKGDHGGDRQPFPVPAHMGQDRRVAPRRPRPADDGVVREAAFVLEDESGPPAAGVFFPTATACASTAQSPPRCVPGPGGPAAAPTSSTRGADTRRAQDGTAPR